MTGPSTPPPLRPTLSSSSLSAATDKTIAKLKERIVDLELQLTATSADQSQHHSLVRAHDETAAALDTAQRNIVILEKNVAVLKGAAVELAQKLEAAEDATAKAQREAERAVLRGQRDASDQLSALRIDHGKEMDKLQSALEAQQRSSLAISDDAVRQQSQHLRETRQLARDKDVTIERLEIHAQLLQAKLDQSEDSRRKMKADLESLQMRVFGSIRPVGGNDGSAFIGGVSERLPDGRPVSTAYNREQQKFSASLALSHQEDVPATGRLPSGALHDGRTSSNFVAGPFVMEGGVEHVGGSRHREVALRSAASRTVNDTFNQAMSMAGAENELERNQRERLERTAAHHRRADAASVPRATTASSMAGAAASPSRSSAGAQLFSELTGISPVAPASAIASPSAAFSPSQLQDGSHLLHAPSDGQGLGAMPSHERQFGHGRSESTAAKGRSASEAAFAIAMSSTSSPYLRDPKKKSDIIDRRIAAKRTPGPHGVAAGLGGDRSRPQPRAATLQNRLPSQDAPSALAPQGFVANAKVEATGADLHRFADPSRHLVASPSGLSGEVGSGPEQELLHQRGLLDGSTNAAVAATDGSAQGGVNDPHPMIRLTLSSPALAALHDANAGDKNIASGNTDALEQTPPPQRDRSTEVYDPLRDLLDEQKSDPQAQAAIREHQRDLLALAGKSSNQNSAAAATRPENAAAEEGPAFHADIAVDHELVEPVFETAEDAEGFGDMVHSWVFATASGHRVTLKVDIENVEAGKAKV